MDRLLLKKWQRMIKRNRDLVFPDEIIKRFQPVKKILKDNFEKNNDFSLNVDKLTPIDLINFKMFFDSLKIEYSIKNGYLNFDDVRCFSILTDVLPESERYWTQYYKVREIEKFRDLLAKQNGWGNYL